MMGKITIGLVGVVLIATVWYVLPIMKQFPTPTGSYSVGLKTVELLNINRNDNGFSSRLVVHIFYPADKSAENSGRALYLGEKMPLFQKAVSAVYHLPEWATRLLFRGIKTYAAIDVPLSSSQSKYPVVLFSHGLLGLPSDMYVTLLEEIASHGYIVMAIDHPYFNEITLFESGIVVSSRDLSMQFQKMSPQEQKDFQSRAIAVYETNLKFMVDYLVWASQNSNTDFYHYCDTTRIVAMGHSAGGTAAIEFCRSDARCKAAIDLDGWYDHIIGQTPVGKPLLLMFGSKSLEVGEPTIEYLKRKELTREQYFEREQKIADHRKILCADPLCKMIVIQGASHQDFSDEVLFKWPLRAWGAADSYTTIRSINQGVVQFLNMHLSRSL